MKPDRSWQALLNPGASSDHFLTEKPLRPFVVTDEYRAENALICSELSRLVYKDDEVERRQILKRAGLVEKKFYQKAGTQAMLAIDSDNRFAVLAFRGSSELLDWLTNLRALPVKWSKGGRIHKGFKVGLEQIQDAVERDVKALNCPLYITGHSLGGSLALGASSLFLPFACYTLGAPQTGDSGFVNTLKATPVHRIVNGWDAVPHSLPILRHKGLLRWLRDTNEKSPRLWGWNPKDAKAFSFEIPPPKILRDHTPQLYSCALERLL